MWKKVSRVAASRLAVGSSSTSSPARALSASATSSF